MTLPATPPPPPGMPPLPPAAGARTFPCDRCGAELVLEGAGASLRCAHCGAEHPLTVEAGAAFQENDLLATLSRQAALRKQAAPVAGTSELQCRSCGAKVAFDGTLTATFCSFCGAPIQRADARTAGDGLPVDAVLPFAVEAPAARKAVKDWALGRWCAPGDFRRRGVSGDLQGVYLPFFTFRALTSTAWEGERGEHYTVTDVSGDEAREEERTRWERVSGSFQKSFEDLLFPAFRSLPPAVLEKLEPWPMERCVPFAPEALAGKLAHAHDLPLEAGFALARKQIEADLREEIEERIGGDEQRIHSVRTGYAGLTYRQLLLPVWLLAYKFGTRTFLVAVNACTGEVVGERPWSAGKIILAILTCGLSLFFVR